MAAGRAKQHSRSIFASYLADGLRSVRAVSLPRRRDRDIYIHRGTLVSHAHTAECHITKIQASAKNKITRCEENDDIYKEPALWTVLFIVPLASLASGSKDAARTIFGIKVYWEQQTSLFSLLSLSRVWEEGICLLSVFHPSPTKLRKSNFPNRESDSRYSQNAVVLVSQHANGHGESYTHHRERKENTKK